MLLLIATLALSPSQKPSALEKMIATEREFAKTCGEIGIRDSFRRYFANDAVMFTPSPVPAQAELEKWPAAPAKPHAVLSWSPVFGDISLDGSLGYSTGPVFQTDTATGKKTYNANYFSIWKRQPDGEYRVVLDIGTQLAAPRDAAAAPTRFGAAKDLHSVRAPNTQLKELLDSEEAFSRQAGDEGYAKALEGMVDSSARYYRSGFAPLAGSEVQAALKAAPAVLSAWEAKGGGVDRWGDFGYTYGTYALTSVGKSQSGGFARVWRRDEKGGWRVVVDILHPAP